MDGIFETLLHYAVLSIEAAGVIVIVAGIVLAGVRYFLGRHCADSYRNLRARLGRSILLGLELLVAADIINTVAVEPSLDSVFVLGIIVIIRTFLSLSLEVEIEGAWPWHRHRH